MIRDNDDRSAVTVTGSDESGASACLTPQESTGLPEWNFPIEVATEVSSQQAEGYDYSPQM